MKSILIFAAFLMVFTTISCKKTENHEPPSPPKNVSLIKAVSTSVNGGAPSINSYEYNSDNKIKYIKYGDGSYCNFIYNQHTIIADSYDKNGVATVKFTYTLNLAGLVASTVYNTSPDGISVYEYNAAGQQIHALRKDKGVVTGDFYYKYNSDGNKVTDSFITVNGTSIYKYEYYTDKISTTEQRNVGQPYFGMESKNCLKKLTLKATNGTITESPYGLPELDAAGRISKISLTYYGNNSVYGYTYY